MKRKSQRGNSSVEMALISIPLIFMIVGTIEISRAMWTYHTLASAVKRGARFASVHGAGCLAVSTACGVDTGDVLQVVKDAGIGLDPAQLSLTFASGSSSQSCAASGTCGDTSSWPAAPYNAVGLPLTISGTYRFEWVGRSLWPGQAVPPTLTASSTEMIQF
jgi:hypothetical protein